VAGVEFAAGEAAPSAAGPSDHSDRSDRHARSPAGRRFRPGWQATAGWGAHAGLIAAPERPVTSACRAIGQVPVGFGECAAAAKCAAAPVESVAGAGEASADG
jgi:hypothetical protein